MANSQIVALVAVSISVVSIGLLVAVNLSLQSDLRNLSNNLIGQSEQIKSLNSELKASQDAIESQKASIAQLQSELNKTNAQLLKNGDEIKSLTQQINSMQANITLMQDRIKLLDDRVTLLEQLLRPQPCLNCQPPTSPQPEHCVSPQPTQQFSKIKDLAAEWNFEGNAFDTSGNDNHGTICGDAAFVSGKVGKALLFDGKSLVRVPNSQSLNFGASGSFTISLWLKSTQSAVSWLVEHRRNNDGAYIGWSLEDFSGKIDGRIRDNLGNDVSVKSTTLIHNGAFHHVVFVVDRSAQISKMYIDGKLEDSVSISSVGDINQNTMGVDIGGTTAPNTYNEFYEGMLDQIRIYTYALTPQEVSSLYNKELQQ